jgi:hypothetical protein
MEGWVIIAVAVFPSYRWRQSGKGASSRKWDSVDSSDGTKDVAGRCSQGLRIHDRPSARSKAIRKAGTNCPSPATGPDSACPLGFSREGKAGPGLVMGVARTGRFCPSLAISRRLWVSNCPKLAWLSVAHAEHRDG